MLNIRHATDRDKPLVLEFCKNTFSWGDYISFVWESWKSKGNLYVLEENGKIAGVYNLVPSDKQTWIEGIRVHPDYRRRGFGKSMLNHAESVSHVKLFRLLVESENYPSIRLVKSMGYQEEDEWHLYLATPAKEKTGVQIANSLSEVANLFESPTTTYADSWRWTTLDRETLSNLIGHGNLLISSKNDKVQAVGIWNCYQEFPNVFQLGYINGTPSGVLEIISYSRNKARELGCERVQIFAPKKISVISDHIEKKSLFYLMRKDILTI